MNESLSARRAWIEIKAKHRTHSRKLVALRKESVDRNSAHARAAFCAQVALRKESVDRNIPLPISRYTARPVALRKESVDRNQ